MNEFLKYGLLIGGGYLVLNALGINPLTMIEQVFGITPSTGTTTTNSPTTTSTAVNTTNSSQTSSGSGGSLASLASQVLTAASNDANNGVTVNQMAVVGGLVQCSWSAWNYYTSRIGGFENLPDYSTLTGQTDPGTAFTFAQYWNLMGPFVSKNYGLSGLGYIVSGQVGMIPNVRWGYGATARASERAVRQVYQG